MCRGPKLGLAGMFLPDPTGTRSSWPKSADRRTCKPPCAKGVAAPAASQGSAPSPSMAGHLDEQGAEVVGREPLQQVRQRRKVVVVGVVVVGV